jgi:hypothetical protein
MKSKSHYLFMIHALAALALLALPASVQAQFILTTNNGAITITSYIGTNPVVVIPSSTNGFPVTGIGPNAFETSGLTSVTIPDSVTNIAPFAFDECTNLTGVAIGANVTGIGLYAFGFCTSMTAITVNTGNSVYSSVDGVLFNHGQTTLIQYPGGKIGAYTIPFSVSIVATQAFTGNYSLISVTIPGSVNNVQGFAFASCTGLTNACFEGNAPTFGSQVFQSDPLTAILYVTGGTGWGTNYESIPIEPCAACGIAGIGALQVTLNPLCAVADGARWQVDGGAWQNSGATVTNLAGGNHTIAFTNIAGWLAPSSQTVLVTSNATNTATANYLEASTPGVITWINIGGAGNWSSSANWDLNRAPTTNDIVLIPNTGGSTCLMDVDATVAGLVIGDCDGGGSDGLGINGHTLEVTGLLTIKSNAVFRVDSGILMGTSNTVISGVLDWTSGGLAGTLTLAGSSVLNISGNPGGQYFSGCLLTNYGTVNWSTDPLNANGSVVIDNYGLWNAQDDRNFNGGYWGAVFNNYGTFRKSGGVGGYAGTYFSSGAVFNQLAGVVDVQSGTNGLWLSLLSGGDFAGGYVTTNLNGITYLGGGDFNINGTLTCTNVIFGGSYLVGTNVINGGLTWQDGQWNNTVVTLSSNSVLIIDNSSYGKGVSGSILTNYGTVNWSAAAVNGDFGTVIDNYGVWNAQDDQNFNGGNWGAVFNNYGTFRKSGGVGGYAGTYFSSGAVFNQLAGVVDVQSGTNGLWLSLLSGGDFAGGYITTNLNGITYLGGGNFNINGTLTCTNVIFGGTYLVGTNVINGGLTWQNGQWNNTVVTLSSNSLLTIDNSAWGKGISGSTLTNYGIVNWSAAPVNGDFGTVIDNYGVWNAQDDQYFNGGNWGAVFNNYGTFRKSGGVGGYPGTYFNSGAVFNQLAGVLDVQSSTNGLQLSLVSGGSFTGGYVTTNLNGITYLGGGNFNINGTLTCTNVLFGGSYLVGTNVINGGLAWINGWWNGLVIVNTNSVVSIYAATYGKTFNGLVINYGTVNWSADQLNANGGAVIDNYGVWNAQDNRYFDGSGLVFNNYGTFVKTGGASGYPGTYFNGPAFNQTGGVLSVQTGEVTLGGSYSLTNGTLNFGINSPTDNGRLQLGGLTLGGALSATVSGSFAPAIGDQFGVIGSSALSGTFSSVNLPAGFSVAYSAGGVLLNVTGPVPVEILSSQRVGTNFVFQFATASGQSYTVQQNDDLATTNWVFYTNLIGTGSAIQLQAPATGTPAKRFFRIREP